MGEIRFVTSSDEHVSDQQVTGFRKDNFKESILKKLEWQGLHAKKFKANYFLRGGDLFHTKNANRNTHATMSRIALIHRAYPCPTFSLAGNHDMSYNDISTVSRQPLGVLFSTGVFHHLKDETFEDGSMKVRVIGLDYLPGMDSNFIRNTLRKKDENYTIAVVHALAALAPEEKIQTFFNEPILDYRDLVFEGCPDVYVFGHYHKDQGIQDHLGVKFVNLGSISRGSLSFENLERKPKISQMRFSSSGIDIEEIIVPHADASEVFDLEKKKKIEKERKNLDEFVAKLRESSSVSPDFSFKDKLSEYPDDIRRLGLELIEAAEIGCDEE
jgi:DNA repair exonuclease SbcCD nuclease subunit